MPTLSLPLEMTEAAPSLALALPTRARRAVTTLFLVNGMLFATWVSRIPAIETNRGMTHAQLGLALFALALGAMIAMPLAGLLSARIGSERVCRMAVLVYAGMLPLLVLAPNTILFALALFGFGIGHGALDVSMNAQAVAVEKSYRRPIMSSFHALFSTGGLLGAALGGGIAAWGLQPGAHFALAAGLLGGLAMTAFRDLHPSPVADAETLPAKGTFFPLPSRGLLALGAIALCVMMGEGAMADWSAVYLRKILATSEGFAAAGYAAFSIAMATGRFFGDKLAAHFGPVQLVRGSALVAVMGLTLLLATPYPGLALVGFAGVGFGFAPIVPMVFSAAGHRAGVDPGVALASVTTLGYLGFLLGPPAIGFAAGVVGLHVALTLLLVSTLLAASLASAVRSGQRPA
jgi:predicted MFS family arabinose efflux permease